MRDDLLGPFHVRGIKLEGDLHKDCVSFDTYVVKVVNYLGVVISGVSVLQAFEYHKLHDKETRRTLKRASDRLAGDVYIHLLSEIDLRGARRKALTASIAERDLKTRFT